MIQEQYVSFETAKLLRDKGFCEMTHSFYKTNGNFGYILSGMFNSDDEIRISAPTQQMAMQWLRLTYGIFIQAYCPVVDMESEIISDVKYNIVISNLKNYCLSFDTLLDDNEYDSPEEAYEDGIRYCLENLIFNKILEYKIDSWQLNKLKEVINISKGISNLTSEESNLVKQCSMIIDAIEHTQGVEKDPIYIPSVSISHGEVHSKPEDYQGITSHASTLTVCP